MQYYKINKLIENLPQYKEHTYISTKNIYRSDNENMTNLEIIRLSYIGSNVYEISEEEYLTALSIAGE